MLLTGLVKIQIMYAVILQTAETVLPRRLNKEFSICLVEEKEKNTRLQHTRERKDSE